jgi:hypothetical protein
MSEQRQGQVKAKLCQSITTGPIKLRSRFAASCIGCVRSRSRLTHLVKRRTEAFPTAGRAVPLACWRLLSYLSQVRYLTASPVLQSICRSSPPL